MRPVTKTLVGVVAVLSGAFTPIIPTELSPGLSEYPAMRGYQYPAGTNRDDVRLIDGVPTVVGLLPDADFTDDDGNGLISVGVFTDIKGQDVYVKIPDKQYAEMGQTDGYTKNPTKTDYISIVDKFTAKVEAAIAIDATSEGYANSTSVTFAHTVTGADTAIVVSVWTFPNGDAVSGVTYNAEALAKQGTRVSDAGGYQNIWGKAGADTGTNNIVVSASPSSQLFVTAASYTGVDQTTPFPDTAVTGAPAGTSLSSTITTTVDQSWLVQGGRSPSRGPTAGANTIVRKMNTTSGDAGWLLDSDGARSTGSNSLNWSYAPSQTTYYVMTAIAPAADAPAGGSESTTTSFMKLQGDVTITGDTQISY